MVAVLEAGALQPNYLKAVKVYKPFKQLRATDHCQNTESMLKTNKRVPSPFSFRGHKRTACLCYFSALKLTKYTTHVAATLSSFTAVPQATPHLPDPSASRGPTHASSPPAGDPVRIPAGPQQLVRPHLPLFLRYPRVSPALP